MIELFFGLIWLAWQGIWWVLKSIFFIFFFLFTTKILRVLVIAILVVGVSLGVLYAVSQDLSERVVYSAVSAVNITNLYNYSKDVYLDSIIYGSLRVFDYKVPKETPYFSAIVSLDKLEDTEPLGILPVDLEVELRSAFAVSRINKEDDEENNTIEEMEIVWIETLFYEEEKPRYAYIILPAAEWMQIAPAQIVKPLRRAVVYATVTNPVLNVRSGPSTDHDIQDRLNQHTRVEVVERLDNSWVRIKYDNNKIGYVYSELLTF